MDRIGDGNPWIRGWYSDWDFELSDYTTRETEVTTLLNGNEKTLIPTQLFFRNQASFLYQIVRHL
jgi:hypothetical protein